MRGLLGVCLNFKETLPPRAQASNLGPILLPILTLPIELENSFAPSSGSAYDEPRLVVHPLSFPTIQICNINSSLFFTSILDFGYLIHHSPLTTHSTRCCVRVTRSLSSPDPVPHSLHSAFGLPTDSVAITIGQPATSSTGPIQYPTPLLFLSHVDQFLGSR